MKIAAVPRNIKMLSSEKCVRLDVEVSVLALEVQAEHVQVVELRQLPQTVRPQV